MQQRAAQFVLPLRIAQPVSDLPRLLAMHRAGPGLREPGRFEDPALRGPKHREDSPMTRRALVANQACDAQFRELGYSPDVEPLEIVMPGDFSTRQVGTVQTAANGADRL